MTNTNNVSARKPVKAWVGIGSNLEHPLQQVEQAVQALAALPETRLLAVSPWYGSTPIGGEPGQPDYVNGVACLETSLEPHALLDALQSIETRQGRVRVQRWGSRTLDLDLLLYGDQSLEDDRLIVPHPRLQERAFVLCPLADLAPMLVLPNGASVASLLAGIPTGGVWRLPATASDQPDLS